MGGRLAPLAEGRAHADVPQRPAAVPSSDGSAKRLACARPARKQAKEHGSELADLANCKRQGTETAHERRSKWKTERGPWSEPRAESMEDQHASYPSWGVPQRRKNDGEVCDGERPRLPVERHAGHHKENAKPLAYKVFVRTTTWSQLASSPAVHRTVAP